MTNYDADYFIYKFKAIPEGEWCKGKFKYSNKFCALGHCGARTGYVKGIPEADALSDLFEKNICEELVEINDGTSGEYLQKSPKQRILAALRDIKDKDIGICKSGTPCCSEG